VGYGLDDRGKLGATEKKKILFFCKESSQAFGLIKPPFQWKQGALPPG